MTYKSYINLKSAIKHKLDFKPKYDRMPRKLKKHLLSNYPWLRPVYKCDVEIENY